MQYNNRCLTNNNNQSMLVLLSINKLGTIIHYWSTRYDSSEKLNSLKLKKLYFHCSNTNKSYLYSAKPIAENSQLPTITRDLINLDSHSNS